MNSRKKVFFFSASPAALSDTEWDKEYMVVKNVLHQSNLRRKFDVEMVCGVTPDTLVDQLPDDCWLIHFSGHGKNGGKIFLEDDKGEGFVPRTQDLLKVLTASDSVKCLLFNSCYSDKIADLAKYYVDYAIGIHGEINNSPAIEFVKYFYKSFVRYETVPMAFKVAINQLSFAKKQECNPIFQSRNNLIMEMVLQEKQAKLLQFLDSKDPLYQEIEKLEKEVRELTASQKDKLSDLLKDNSNSLGIIWFVENYETLAGQIGNQIMDGEDEEMKEDFSYEVSYLFGLLRACLVKANKLYSKADVASLKSEAFSNNLFERAFDEIPSLVPEAYRNGDFLPYLRDHIKHLKSLL